ncbi:MAG: hypothetical protein GC185_07875 [Alphaproteobacteria bacterium]|nr:hypothetical protein [Alphaproteobacteria bacterium]
MTDFHGFMAGGGWALFALFTAIFTGGFYLVNQYLKQPGHLLVFWMRVLVVIFLSPLIHEILLPRDPVFYLTVFVTVLGGTFADIRTLNVSAAYGGGVTARVQPVTVIGAFFLWFLFDPALLSQYAAHPLNTAGILIALCGCVFFAMRLNRCVVTRRALVAMLPALAGYTATATLNKFAMGRGQLEGAVFGYIYVQSFFAVFAVGGYVLWRERASALAKLAEKGEARESWANRRMAMAALLAALLWICSMTYKNYAMAFTPNPSYVGAIALTSPVFIALFYRFVKFREEADVASGMGVVFCALLLVLMTAH